MYAEDNEKIVSESGFWIIDIFYKFSDKTQLLTNTNTLAGQARHALDSNREDL